MWPAIQPWRGSASMIVFIVLCLLFTAFTVPASAISPGAPDGGKREYARALTQDLLRMNGQFARAHDADRGALIADLVKTATLRHEALRQLMELNPGEMLRLSIPAAVRAGFAGEVEALMEEEVTLEGDLEVMYEEGFSGSRLLFGLRTDHGRFALHFVQDEPTDLETGIRVRVHGVRLDSALALSSGSSSSTLQTLSAPPPNTFGEQKTAVILVNFADKATQPYSLSDARGVVFTTTNNFDLENSQGQTWLSGNVFGWYTIPLSSTACDYTSIANYAKQSATSAASILSSYKRFVYGFPSNACSWWGLGTVGGSPSNAWINGTFNLKVVGHEMGHNLGLYHSRTAADEYGDTLDIMGNPSSDHFNAFQKERLGWLNYGAQPPITTVQATGDYFIGPYAAADANPKALKILKSTDPSTGLRTWYYVEHRRGVGFDSSIASNANVLNGVVVHTGSESTGNSSFLLDMTPDTTTFSDPALAVSSSFNDASAGVTITPVSTSSTGASVRVTLASQPCVQAPPTLVASSTSLYGTAGTTLRYTLTLTNKDGATCAATTFSIRTSAPAGWTAAVNPVSVSLAAGGAATVLVDITSPSTAADGLYDTVVTAASSADAAKTASATLTYGASRPACVPGTPRLSASSSAALSGPAGTKFNFTFTLTNGDGSACTATYNLAANTPAGWSAAINPATVTLAAGASASITVNVTSPAGAADQQYGVNLVATNAADSTKTAVASVACTVSTVLTASVATDRALYAPGDTVAVTTTVKINGAPASGSSVSLKITKSNGIVVTAALTTGSNGTAVYKYRLARKDPTGPYTAGALATAVSRSATGSAAISVSAATARK